MSGKTGGLKERKMGATPRQRQAFALPRRLRQFAWRGNPAKGYTI
jgi:hypothetical protein